MTTKIQKSSAQPQSQQQPKSKPPAERQEGPGPQQAAPATPMHGGSVESQVAMLQRMPASQQQAMLSEMGRTQSNRHVQRVVEALRKGSDGAATQEGASTAPAQVEQNVERMKGGGQPMAEQDRSFFESRMGGDFGDVRIHTNKDAQSNSQDLGARAFTVGSDIAFNDGEYQPGTSSGRHLLAHELTHVMQQTGAVQAKKEEGEGQKGAEDQISSQDIQYEMMAHKMGYQDSIDPKAGELLKRWGYQPNWASKIDDGKTGLFVGLIMPDEEHPDLTPVLVFRGTAGWRDIVSDANPVSVGYNQFKFNKDFIAQMIDEAGGRVDITGHSLGGALAQHAAAAFASNTGRCVTFQAPGVTSSQAREFAEKEEGDRPEVVHHIAGGDIVDTAGSKHLEGEFFRHTPGGGPLSHMKFLLTSPELKEKREELGLDDETLKGLDIEAITNNKPIEQSEEYPHAIKKGLAETGRKGLGAILYPILAGINTLTQNDDSKIRETVTSTEPEELAKRPVSERSYMIRRLCSGMTGNADEQAILNILDASAQAGDLVNVVDVADAWKMAKAIDGAEYKQLREKLNEHYYAQTSQSMALSLIQKCMDGWTNEWQEEMIADILVARSGSDGREIVTKIGQIYKKGGYKEGFNKLQWQLSGAEQRRVEEAYGED